MLPVGPVVVEPSVPPCGHDCLPHVVGRQVQLRRFRLSRLRGHRLFVCGRRSDQLLVLVRVVVVDQVVQELPPVLVPVVARHVADHGQRAADEVSRTCIYLV